MIWPFQRPDACARTAFGFTFQLTEHHLTPARMDSMKQSYDMLGEKALEKLDVISPPPRAALPLRSTGDQDPVESKRDLYILLRKNALDDETLGSLWNQVNAVPSWVCWDQIARGQDCFYRYGGPILTGLAYQSLLGGMVKSFNSLQCLEPAKLDFKGAARVVETLARTGLPHVSRCFPMD